MSEIVLVIIQLVVMILAFLIGRYIIPNIPESITAKITNAFNLLVEWADKFVCWAKEFMSDSSGEEKMAAVVEQLQEIADSLGIEVTKEQLQAIAQAAYDAMIAGQESVTTITVVPSDDLNTATEAISDAAEKITSTLNA